MMRIRGRKPNGSSFDLQVKGSDLSAAEVADIATGRTVRPLDLIDSVTLSNPKEN